MLLPLHSIAWYIIIIKPNTLFLQMRKQSPGNTKWLAQCHPSRSRDCQPEQADRRKFICSKLAWCALGQVPGVAVCKGYCT